MPVHLDSLGMYGQDEPKPEWVSSAQSCFFIELILKYFSVPKLEWKKKKKVTVEAFLNSTAIYLNFRVNPGYFITIHNRTVILKTQRLLLNPSVL